MIKNSYVTRSNITTDFVIYSCDGIWLDSRLLYGDVRCTQYGGAC